MAKIERALLSVYDKTGLIPFARTLAESGVELISTGGTCKTLREAGLKVIELSDYTGFPEMLDGRVKTLHPKVHGGLLYLRDNPAHLSTAQQHQLLPIDLVVVNLYPFEQTIAQPNVTLEGAIEQIDIGGPAMLRSAAKNHQAVSVVVDPADYEEVARQIQSDGNTTMQTRQKLAARVFLRTSRYDTAIAAYLNSQFDPAPPPQPEHAQPPQTLSIQAPLVQTLRYGENPHQKAALYGNFRDYFQQFHGKELSYNNILDLTAAASLITDFSGAPPTVAILKHTNPCGVGQDESLAGAWAKAFATDQQAPFGGVIVVNACLDLPCAKAIAEIFSEIILAPDFSPEAAALLQKKKNLRLLKIIRNPLDAPGQEIRSVGAGSYLAQDRDFNQADPSTLSAVTHRPPSARELQAMSFGWRIVKHVKSNAIVYAGPDRTLGIGAGQMSRVDASRIAVGKAQDAAVSLQGSVVCSDAFFPFPDGLIAAAEAGATAAIQPGGSVRDAEVIAAANQRNMAMVFTGVRHFRH